MARDGYPTRLLVPSSVGFAPGPVLLVLDDFCSMRLRRPWCTSATTCGRGVTITKTYGILTLLRRLFRQARPYWPHIGGLLLLSLLLSLLTLLVPLPLKIAVDSAIGSRPLPGFLDALVPADVARSRAGVLVLAAFLIVMVALLLGLADLASSVLRTYTGEKLVLSFRALLFRHAQRLSLLYHDSRGTTDAAYRIQYDAPSLQWIMTDSLPSLATTVITLAGMVYVTFRIDWQLGLVALAVSPFLFLSAWAYGRRLRRRWREIYQLDSSALSVVQEALAAIRVVQAFGREAHEGERFVHRSSESVRTRIRVAFIEGGFALLVGLTTAAGTAAVLFVGVRNVRSGALTLGDLLLVMGYLTQLYGLLNQLSKSNTALQSSLASAERAFSLLDEAPDVVERPDARPLERASGAVAFNDVSFAYRENHPVLRDVSFEVDPGTRVGISGRTGAGKTTLMSLLTRFYDPTAGRILLDGVDLRDCRIADLRNQFAIVLQEPVLFSTSIAENIAYARPDGSEEEIVEAAKAANAHEFIVGLPHGYESRVGERGMSLSGGERQRIALARAFLKDAPLLILDEPTSSVDTRTEAAIMDAMERLMRGRTTFMIAHRLGTLANCDVRLEVEGGRVAAIERRPALTSSADAGEWPHRSKGSPAGREPPDRLTADGGVSEVAVPRGSEHAGAEPEILSAYAVPEETKSRFGRPTTPLQPDLGRTILDEPEKSAELFKDIASRHWGVDLDYRPECLLLVEQLLIDALQGESETPPVIDALMEGLGYYVGEIIRRNAGSPGSWRPARDWSEGPVIEVEGVVLDPLGKARTFLSEGQKDSVAFYADYVFEQLNCGRPEEIQDRSAE
jgi:ATP-binding cassette, subfamily B, bacterial